MSKVYTYSKPYVLLTYGLAAVLPLLIVGMLFISTEEVQNVGIAWATSLALILISLISSTWIINMLKTQFIIDDEGFKYSSLFKKHLILWNQISGINRMNYLNNNMPYSPKSGSCWNLKIKTDDGKDYTIYHYLNNLENLSTEIEKRMQETDKSVQIDSYIFTSEGFDSGYKSGDTIIQGIVLIVILTIGLRVLWIVRDISNPIFTIILLAVLVVAVILFRKKKLPKTPPMKVLADNSGITVINWIGMRHYPWHTIKSAKIEDEKKGPIRIELFNYDISLWNFNDLSENTKLTKLIEEKKSDVSTLQATKIYEKKHGRVLWIFLAVFIGYILSFVLSALLGYGILAFLILLFGWMIIFIVTAKLISI